MIWVIGANGMLGSELCRQLEKNKISYVASDKEVDITNPESIDSFITEKESESYLGSMSEKKSSKIKWIVNCAAYTAVEKAESEPELAALLNTTGPKNIAHAARFHGIKLIHISTDYVFGGQGNIPFTEEMPKNPLGVYGKTKSDGEDEIIQAMTQYYILRTAWLYGYGRPNFVYTMINLMNSKNEIKVVNDQFGTPTFAGDLADAIIKIITKSEKNNTAFNKNTIIPFGIYNFTNLGQISWYDFAQKIYLFGKKYKRINNECQVNTCTTAEYGAKVERPAYSVLSKDKIIKTLKLKIPSWEKSLEKFIKDSSFDSLK